MIVKIEKLDHSGQGITKVNNKITFVKNALPDELVDIIITKEKKNYNEGKLIKVINKSEHRITSICPYYNECGGCELMHMDYSYQIKYKKEKVINIIKKYASLDINPKVFESNDSLYYRNKITLHEKNNKLGYMKQKTNEIIEINECPISMKSINEYLKNLKEPIKNKLIIRTNEKGEIISTLKNQIIIMNINEFKFYIDINSFFQVNNYICSKVFEFIDSHIFNEKTCLDLYSGVGTLSILASKKVSKVYGIEINEYSHKNANLNLELNNIKNVTFLLGPVEEKIKEISSNIDLIITDPPRSGMDKISLDIIKEMKPKKIIYMSCDPMTLARDLNLLKDLYTIEDFAIFDMFPNTKHVECVCVMSKEKNIN